MATPIPMFPDAYFQRQDERDDSLFYTSARKVVHIDDGAIRRLSDHLAGVLPPGGVYLDLMSSWRSHLPASLAPSRVVGLGMNADEMADNPQLHSYVVQSLNANPILPFEDAVFDAAICTVSVQYLIHPVEVFTQVARVCKPGAPFVVSFSNRCFPSKAVAVWLGSSDNQHMALVTRYFEAAGGWEAVTATAHRPLLGDPLFIVSATSSAKQA